MNVGSFFRHASVYTLTSFLVSASGIVLLPLYTRCLKPEGYGVLEILGRLAETVGMVLLFGGVRQALVTFYRQSETDEDKLQVVSATFGLLLLLCVVGGGAALILAEPITAVLRQNMKTGADVLTVGMVRLAFLSVLLEPFVVASLALLQARFESVNFLVMTLAQLFFRIGLCVFLVAGLGFGVFGVVLGTSVAAIIFCLLLSWRELRRGVSVPSFAKLREMVGFALPFLPGAVCFFILHNGDRFLLLRYGAREVGLYGLGYRLAQIVAAFSLAPLCQVWYSQLYNVARQDDAPDVFGRAFTRILAAYAVAGLGICLFVDEAVLLLAGHEYLRATSFVLPVFLACFLQAMASLMDSAFYVRRRTGLKLVVTLASTGVMLALYFALIPRYGAWGAALATVGRFAMLAGLTFAVTRRVFPVRYEWGRLAALALLWVSLWCLAQPLPVAMWAVPIKLAVWLGAPAIAWWVGLISPLEKQYLRDVASQVAARCQHLLARGRVASGPTPSNEI